MLACLLAMLLPLSSQPLQLDGQTDSTVTQSEAPAEEQFEPQQSFFGPDDPTPKFRLHRIVSDDTSDGDPEAIGREFYSPDGVSVSSESSSFLARCWPYILMVVALTGWGVSHLRLKTESIFKKYHDTLKEEPEKQSKPKVSKVMRMMGWAPGSVKSTELKGSKQLQQNGTDEKTVADKGISKTDELPLGKKESAAEGISKIDELPLGKTGPSMLEFLELEPQLKGPVKGQFKVATRFQQPKEEDVASSIDEETSTGEPAIIREKSLGSRPDVRTSKPGDWPADDEFEVDAGEETSGVGDFTSYSGMLSEEQRAKILEAAEILAAVGKLHTKGEAGS